MLKHVVEIYAPEYTPVKDSEAIPTGELLSVVGTPMDFTSPKTIGQDVEADFEQLKLLGGYDHNYALCREKGELKKAAKVVCQESGIQWRSLQTFRACSFISAILLKKKAVRKAASMKNAEASVWKPSTIQTPATSRLSRLPY